MTEKIQILSLMLSTLVLAVSVWAVIKRAKDDREAYFLDLSLRQVVDLVEHLADLRADLQPYWKAPEECAVTIADEVAVHRWLEKIRNKVPLVQVTLERTPIPTAKKVALLNAISLIEAVAMCQYFTTLIEPPLNIDDMVSEFLSRARENEVEPLANQLLEEADVYSADDGATAASGLSDKFSLELSRALKALL